MPTFRELFAEYEQNGMGALYRSAIIPACKHCNKQIFQQLNIVEYDANVQKVSTPNLPYYRTWLLEVNDFDKLLCFDHYKELIAPTYEKQKRSTIISADSKRYAQLNIPKRYWGRTFANRKDVPQQAKMLEVALEYANEGYKGTYLMASRQRGFGKTDLAVCLAIQYWIDNGSNSTSNYWKDQWSCLNSEILFLNETDLYFMIRSTYKPDARYSEYDIYEWLTSITKFLVLDDVFFAGDKEFIKSVISRLVHKRCEENDLPLVITTNYTLPVMHNVDQSLTSRLSRGKYVSQDPKILTIDLRKEV